MCDWFSHHAVHCKVLVLRLQLHGLEVVVADICVACQEQTLVVHDPIKHLRNTHNQEDVSRLYGEHKLYVQYATPRIQRHGLPLLRVSFQALLRNISGLWCPSNKLLPLQQT